MAEEKVSELLARAEKAMGSIAAKVFNDNGDLTVDVSALTYDEIVAVYFTHRALRRTPTPVTEDVGATARVIVNEMVARNERNGFLTDWWCKKLDALNTALSASPSPPKADGPGEVSVKPLEWPNTCERGQRVHSSRLLGGMEQYCIAHYGGSEPDSGVVFRWARAHFPWSEAFFSYQDAINAAQSDYEARILSALVSPSIKREA